MLFRLNTWRITAFSAALSFIVVSGAARADDDGGPGPEQRVPQDASEPSIHQPSRESPGGTETAVKDTTGRKTSPLVAPTADVNRDYNTARKALLDHKYKKAIDLLDAVIASAPGFEPAYADRAVAYLNSGENSKAIADLSTALDLTQSISNPKLRAYLLANRGGAYLNLRQIDKALADLDQAISLNKDLSFAFANRAYASFLAKNYDRTIEDASRALALKPGYEFGLSVRGYGYNGKKQFNLAIADFRAVLKTQPTNREAILGLHRANIAGKEHEDPAQIKIVRLADTTCEPNCPEWIAIVGKIEEGTAAEFKSVLASLGPRNLPVLIDSGGGSVSDGMEIGRAIRARALDVIVARTQFVACPPTDKACAARTPGNHVLGVYNPEGSVCASSCAFVIAAGTRRIVHNSAVVGVHQIVSTSTRILRQYEIERQWQGGRYVEVRRRLLSETRGPTKTVETKEQTYTKIEKYFTDMGLDTAIMPMLLSAQPSGMRWLEQPEMLQTRMSTDSDVPGRLLKPAARAGLAVQRPSTPPAVPANRDTKASAPSTQPAQPR